MRLVVKVGTSSLTHKTGLLNIRKVQKLCVTLSDIQNAGHQVILVSSGAIGMGVGKLHLDRKPTDMATKQAAAAVGQCELMYVYDKLFGEYNHTVAQILLTGNDVDNEIHRENIRSTISRLLELGVIPIINENDSVATAEIDEINALGDNDTLAAIVSVCIGADLLVLMSDIDGLYTEDPRKNPDAKLIHEVENLTEEMMESAGGAGSSQGTGSALPLSTQKRPGRSGEAHRSGDPDLCRSGRDRHRLRPLKSPGLSFQSLVLLCHRRLHPAVDLLHAHAHLQPPVRLPDHPL